jgi:signal transduction histidine kinase
MRTIVRALRRDQTRDQTSAAAGAAGASGADPGDAAAAHDVDLSPAPGVRDLAALGRRGRGGGPDVDVELLGDLDDLSPAVGSAVYRLAQESVTNARRHARHATRIAVSVAADEASVRLRVSDAGDVSATRPAASPGFGLVGMTERASLLGGTCEAGPDGDRGWTVTAVLPRVA